jgi:hypothetical protein
MCIYINIIMSRVTNQLVTGHIKLTNQCQQFMSIIMVSLWLKGNKVVCIITSVDIYAINIIQLNTFSWMR